MTEEQLTMLHELWTKVESLEKRVEQLEGIQLAQGNTLLSLLGLPPVEEKK